MRFPDSLQQTLPLMADNNVLPASGLSALSSFLNFFLNLSLRQRFKLHSFYAAGVVLTLMLGNIGLAPVAEAAQPSLAPASQVTTAQYLIDTQILAAKNAFDRRDLKALDAARLKLASSEHPLASYVTYWWLSANLSASSNFALAQATEIQAFLAANADSPIADVLRREWLKILGNAGQWSLFNTALPQLIADDPDVTCHAWRYRLNQGDRDATSEVRALWNVGKAAPDACYAAFQAIHASANLSTDDIWRRVRVLLENKQINDARRSAAFLRNLPAHFERASAAINLDPVHYLSHEKPDLKSRASTELYIFAVTRAARDDAVRAAELLEKQDALLSPADRAYAWAQVGLYGGMQHEADALGWFQRATDAQLNAPLNDNQAAWKARAALRAGNWPVVREAIQAMSPVERREPSWRYWLARSYEKKPVAGSMELTKSLKESLARENNFYALLAAEELGITQQPNWQGYKPTAQELSEMASRASIERVLALYRLDLKVDGLREWYSATKNFNDQELLAAAEVARTNNIPDRAISAADRTLAVHDYAQRFPIPYRDSLQPHAKNNQLDEAWVYGLIRQESRFMAEVKSRVGAMGLMQLMPATASWVANQVGMKNFASARAVEVSTNLNLGTYYLRHVLDDLGHPVLATAAYNAGPGRARRWRADTPLEGAIYAETIPFSETRDYVKKVMTNKWFYRNRFGATPMSLADIMGIVPGRNSNMSASTSGTARMTRASTASAAALSAKAKTVSAPVSAPAYSPLAASAPVSAPTAPPAPLAPPAPPTSPTSPIISDVAAESASAVAKATTPAALNSIVNPAPAPALAPSISPAPALSLSSTLSPAQTPVVVPAAPAVTPIPIVAPATTATATTATAPNPAPGETQK